MKNISNIMKIHLVTLAALIIGVSADINSQSSIAYVSSKNGLVLRESPGVKSPKIMTIAYFEKVTVIEESKRYETIDGSKANWVKIKYRSFTGWVFSGFLTKNISLLSFEITGKTIVLYFPEINESDYEKNSELVEIADDYNYYSSELIKTAKKYNTTIITYEGKDRLKIKNKAVLKEIVIPVKEHAFGYIFINTDLEYKIFPGVYSNEIIDFYKKFFNILQK